MPPPVTRTTRGSGASRVTPVRVWGRARLGLPAPAGESGRAAPIGGSGRVRSRLPARVLAGALLCVAAAAPAGCAPDAADPSVAQAQAPVLAGIAAGVPRLRPVVLGTLPHDPGAWTEGLEIDGDTLYESTGLAGRSRLRRLDPATGAERASDPLPDGLYGEGITVVGGRIWQLTYRDGVALGWDAGTGPGIDGGTDSAGRAPVRRTPWSGEGWGLCHTADGRVLASDGGSELRVLAGTDLTRLGTLAVRIAGRPLPGLNELECTSGAVWANVYPTDWLVRIDASDGRVTAVVDASGLLPPDQRSATGGTAAGAVLNGIAAIPGTDEFLLTGKLWPTLFRVRFTR